MSWSIVTRSAARDALAAFERALADEAPKRNPYEQNAMRLLIPVVEGAVKHAHLTDFAAYVAASGHHSEDGTGEVHLNIRIAHPSALGGTLEEFQPSPFLEPTRNLPAPPEATGEAARVHDEFLGKTGDQGKPPIAEEVNRRLTLTPRRQIADLNPLTEQRQGPDDRRASPIHKLPVGR